MRDVLGVRAMVAFGVVMAATPAGADDPADAEKAKLKRWEQQLKESLDWYQVVSSPRSREPMKPQTILRWGNPIRSQKGETALILWADAGRPEALASVYPWSGNLVYECVSLARDDGLTAKENGRTVWSPRGAGVKFREVPGAPTPAKTAYARLGQMKAVAEKFKVAIINYRDGREVPEELRLLPKETYRYDLAGSKTAHPDLVDGAIFAFVQGTDPEAVLMVEAIHEGDRTTWRYGFGRATGWKVEAKLGPETVWTAPDLPSWSDPTSPGRTLGRPLVE